MKPMTAALHFQPTNTPIAAVRFNPAASSQLSRNATAVAHARRPVRGRSLAMALAVGALIGGLISMSAAGAGSVDMAGIDVKTELVAAP